MLVEFGWQAWLGWARLTHRRPAKVSFAPRERSCSAKKQVMKGSLYSLLLHSRREDESELVSEALLLKSGQ